MAHASCALCRFENGIGQNLESITIYPARWVPLHHSPEYRHASVDRGDHFCLVETRVAVCSLEVNAVSHGHTTSEEIVSCAPEKAQTSISEGKSVITDTLGSALRQN